MENQTEFIVIFVTAGSEDEAKKITDTLLEAKKAACANIIPKVNSFFWWQGKIDNAEEVLLIIKSKKVLLDDIVKLVKKVHSYDVPEIIALPIIGGSKDYLNWIDVETEG